MKRRRKRTKREKEKNKKKKRKKKKRKKDYLNLFEKVQNGSEFLFELYLNAYLNFI